MMPDMRRRAFAILLVTSLVLCIITTAGWLCSYWRIDAVSYSGKWRGGELSFVEGKLYIWTWTTDSPTMMAMVLSPGFGYARSALRSVRPRAPYSPSQPDGPRAYILPGGNTTSHFRFAGVYSHTYRVAGTASANDIWYFSVPCWLILLATAFLPALWLWRRIRHAQYRWHGLCPKCGYDLRASKERCPECGTAIAGV